MRTFFFFFLILVSLSFFSCRPEPLKPYMVVIPEDTMENVIIDFFLYEAYIRKYVLEKHDVFAHKDVYDSLYARYAITEKQFVWNVIYYTRRMKMEALVDSSIARLSERKALLEQKNARDVVP